MAEKEEEEVEKKETVKEKGIHWAGIVGIIIGGLLILAAIVVVMIFASRSSGNGEYSSAGNDLVDNWNERMAAPSIAALEADLAALSPNN